EELTLARPLGLAFKSSGAQAHLLHADTVSHSGLHAKVLQTFPKQARRKFAKCRLYLNGSLVTSLHPFSTLTRTSSVKTFPAQRKRGLS
ncbi:MAG: hypothetical protein WAP57_05990, partial [Aquabacterium commune]|uniref:hypothetical protein n=1 Tax=Aquabacterium commune TaxID=70586 RepID=UPI003BAFDDC3